MTQPMTVTRAREQDDRVSDLLVATGRGDTVAYARVYEHLVPRVRALAVRVVRDPDLADEVAQEVLAEVWRTAHAFDPARGSGLGWVMTMTHHRAVDRVRHEAALRRRDEAYGLRVRGVPFDETFTTWTSQVEATSVRQALGSLTPLQRQAIELAYFRGLSHTQVAGHLQVPLGTIKSRIRDGLLRLRSCLPELAPEAA